MKIVKLFKDEEWVGFEVFVTENRSFVTLNWSKAPEADVTPIKIRFSKTLGLMIEVIIGWRFLIQFFSKSVVAQEAEAAEEEEVDPESDPERVHG